MKTVELENATAPLADYARKIATEPVIITTHGKPVAALVSISNADIETVSLSTSPQFAALIERSRAQLGALGGLSADEVRRRLAQGGASVSVD